MMMMMLINLTQGDGGGELSAKFSSDNPNWQQLLPRLNPRHRGKGDDDNDDNKNVDNDNFYPGGLHE